MPILKNPKHERFCQLVASGVGQTEAYEAAGYKADTGNAARLTADDSVRQRIAELLSKGAATATNAISAKQRFIERAWERAAETLEKAGPEDMPGLKALVDSALNAEKDQRVVEGGVSDRTSQDVTVQRKAALKRKVDDAFAKLASKDTGGSEKRVH